MKILVWAILVVALGMSAWTASNPSRFWPWSAAPKVITGHARVIDGDTIAVGKVRVRLEGIDAPETDQKCRDSAGRDYLCGITASKALRNLIGREPVACERVGQDRYGRVLGVCSNAAGVDMSAELVRRGPLRSGATLSDTLRSRTQPGQPERGCGRALSSIPAAFERLEMDGRARTASGRTPSFHHRFQRLHCHGMERQCHFSRLSPR